MVDKIKLECSCTTAFEVEFNKDIFYKCLSCSKQYIVVKITRTNIKRNEIPNRTTIRSYFPNDDREFNIKNRNGEILNAKSQSDPTRIKVDGLYIDNTIRANDKLVIEIIRPLEKYHILRVIRPSVGVSCL